MPRKPKTRAPYKMVSPPTWELARADYLNGMTAEAVAVKHGIGLANLRQTMARKGWTKRALADARATPGPGGPPLPAAAPAEAPPPAGGDVMEEVLTRARASLAAGRGGEASTLMKAAREYVILRQEVEDARYADEAGNRRWDEAQPERAGAIRESLLLQTLHDRWNRLSDEEWVRRLDPDGTWGMADLLKTVQEAEAEEAKAEARARKRGW